MNKLLKKNITRAFALIFTAILASCNDDDKGFADFDAGGTATEALAGEWFVREYSQSGEVLSGYFKVSTFNTSANSASEIWLQDDGTIDFQSKVDANVADLSFSVVEAENIFDDTDNVTVADGKIIKSGGLASVTRTVVDSISFIYSSTTVTDPLIVSGHRRTGFQVDEH